MEAIILAGGLGTRLRSELPKNLPKAMAPVNGRPFLTYLLDQLQSNGFTRIILSVSFGHAVIQDYFENAYKNIKLEYAIEKSALGTGGGIKNALSFADSNYVYAFNGDSLLQADFRDMYHQMSDVELSVALVKVNDAGRYGGVVLSDGVIVEFLEKNKTQTPAYINAGAYLIHKDKFLARTRNQTVFSFEKEYIEKYVTEIMPKPYITNGYFIDIGVPEDYRRFCEAPSYFDILT